MGWKLLLTLSASCLIAVLAPTPASAQHVDVGASFGSQGLDAFYLSIGEHYGVPVSRVAHVGRYVPVYEVPVVYSVAHHAHVAPSSVLDLRRAGRSWMDITLHFGLSPEIYYVPLAVDPGPPYGHAYGYYKKHPRARWRTIRLADADVVNLVNLRFLADRHHVKPERIVRMRGAGKDFLAIERHFGRGGPPGHARGARASAGKGGGVKAKAPGHSAAASGKARGHGRVKTQGAGKGRVKAQGPGKGRGKARGPGRGAGGKGKSRGKGKGPGQR